MLHLTLNLLYVCYMYISSIWELDTSRYTDIAYNLFPGLMVKKG